MSKISNKPIYKTENDLPTNVRQTAIQILNERLATGLDVAMITKQAHWNVKGMQFIAVHLMLDGFRKDIDDINDSVAERITALGGSARGTIQTVANSTTLKPYPETIAKVEDHLYALIERYGVFANSLREAIDITAEAGDAGTADLFTAASRTVDKQLWFLEAHVQK